MACGAARRGTRSFLEAFHFVDTMILEVSLSYNTFRGIKGPPSCILALWRVSIQLDLVHLPCIFSHAVSSVCSDSRLVSGNVSFQEDNSRVKALI